MHVVVIGAGRVGLTVAVCLASAGIGTTCVDSDSQKVSELQSGRCPIFEPGLEDMLKRAMTAGRLAFTTDLTECLHQAQIVFICVGTPPLADGRVDLDPLMSVIQQIARRIEEEKIIVIKSTVPVGTAELVEKVFIENSQHRCEVVSCPEFLREGTAVADFMNPGRIVIGARREATARQVLEVYRPFLRKDTPVFIMDNRSAELTKYAANLALAARISLINELARLAEVVGADIELVRRAVGADPRIGNAYMLPGVGFGGSCLPKDVRALVRIGQDHGIRLRMAEAILAVNDEQVLWFMQKILRHFQNSLRGKRITVWGLAFKPNTDDVRESVSLRIVEELITRGAVVTVYDPKAMLAARTVLGDRVNYAEEMYTSLSEAEALVVVTEWEEFVHADLKEMVLRMRKPVLFDGRNIYNPSELREVGFVYYGVGRSGELRNTPSWEG